MPIVHLAAGRRSMHLIDQAYEEEGLTSPDIDERVRPAILLYPRSYVDAVNEMPGDKRIDYSFMGSLYRPEVFPHRAWLLDFARHRFTERSYLQLSESPPEHQHLGSFDHTGEVDGVWVPKDVPWPERGHFNPAYFQVLRQSQFTLCPAGDAPWSCRFWESIMCRSIPIVEDPEHAGRNELDRAIGYRYYLRDDEHVYDEDLVEANYELFVRHNTLMTALRAD